MNKTFNIEIPLRDGEVLVSFQGLPMDATREDFQRICRFLELWVVPRPIPDADTSEAVEMDGQGG